MCPGCAESGPARQGKGDDTLPATWGRTNSFQSGKDMTLNAGLGLPRWAASGLSVSVSVLSQTRSPCAAERSGAKDFLQGRISQLIDLDEHALKAMMDALCKRSPAEST